ncbi:hypothetical protein ACQKL5_09370 [Peribacillus sp. NPDC097675]|uniref:hypothetical protein n=1 Tax=Peribacillus sp. NPDC097675 TaxID=3390618 RepID=UPI003CFD75D3
MDTFLYFFYLAGYIALFIWAITLAHRYGWVSASNVLLFVIFGLIVDNTLLAFGRYIGTGHLLESISYIRYWGHALFTPTLVLFAWDSLKKADIGWAKKSIVKYISYILVIALIVYELFTETLGLRLHAEWKYGVLSYANTASSSGPPVMVLIVSLVLIVSAFMVWRSQKWIWFLLGTIIMTVGSAVPLPIKSDAYMNGFELILLISLLATKHYQVQKEQQHETSS